MTAQSSISEIQRELLVNEARAWLRWADGLSADDPSRGGVGYDGIKEGDVGPGGPHGVAHGGLGRSGSATSDLAGSELKDTDLVRAMATKILYILGEPLTQASSSS
jgi:hypothetical protein